MSNILHFTEAFDNAYWTSSVTVTPNTAAAPAIYGSGAGFGDTLADTSAVSVQGTVGTYETIPDDSSHYFASIHVKKDAVTTRFPTILVQMTNGSGPICGVSFNTSTGAIAEANGTFPATISKGVVDLDANLWRVWFEMANDTSGNTQARMMVRPAQASIIGDADDVTLIASAIVGGANLTRGSALQSYQPDPPYAFPSWVLVK